MRNTKTGCMFIHIAHHQSARRGYYNDIQLCHTTCNKLFWTNLDVYIFHCQIVGMTQDNHNKIQTTKNKGIWSRSQHLGLTWSQHQAGKPRESALRVDLESTPNQRKTKWPLFPFIKISTPPLKEYNRLLIKDC